MNNMQQLSREMILHLQVDEILKHKWIESEKAMRDLGNEAVFDWVRKYAAGFRAYWEDRLKEANKTENKPDNH
ncbi:MAG: hypothetical protein RBT16_08180 [Desulfococcus multivorans]|jgi:hypothetical protein|uniref:hypothetical protein n=1 Tax=Desulfococcus sp. TaxID=2025834 RepID=UPI002A4445C4|nr:hypothetical protein [Desulfococcus multivorans]